MKGYCSVWKCENNVNTDAHLFPKDEVLRDKWLKAIKCGNWKPGKWSKICCKHFKSTDYVQYSNNETSHLRKILKPNAIPSIFPWNSNKKKISQKSTRIIVKNILNEAITDRLLNNIIQRILNSIQESRLEEKRLDSDTCSEDNLNHNIIESESVVVQSEIDLLNDVTEVEIDSNKYRLDLEENFNKKGNFEQSDNEINNETTKVQSPFKSAFSVTIENFKNDNKSLNFYTGLENYEKFKFVFQTLGPACYELDYIYKSKPTISVLDQFFLTLMILKQNKTYYEISLFFNIPLKQVGNIFITWIRFMKLQWSEISQWPSKELVNFYTPSDFRNKCPGTRGIIDGTEIGIQKPGVPTAQQSTFSTYKNKPTVKTLVFASPGGLVTYISPAYGGSTSDRQIIERCNLINLCDPGDTLMADKGFDIQDLLAPYGIKLNIPTFFKKKNQISAKTILQDKKICSKRVHIERIIGLGKTYKILEGLLIASHTKLADDIIFVCFMLCNFRRSIVNKEA